jgi:AcrR family transcriptional regulator
MTKVRKSKVANGKNPVPADEGTGARHELLAADVLDKAAALFAAQGFAATSLKDVADAVGLQRSSIYYYYPSKDALLEELIQGVTIPVVRVFRDVGAEKLSPLATLREVVRRLVLWVADPKTHFRLMDRSEAELPEAVAKVHRDAKRHVLAEMVKLIDSAIMAGEARAKDSRVGALSVIGMAMWTAWWYQPGYGPSLEAISEEIADNAVAVVQRAAPAKQIATVADLTNEIREHLALIDRLTERGKR